MVKVTDATLTDEQIEAIEKRYKHEHTGPCNISVHPSCATDRLIAALRAARREGETVAAAMRELDRLNVPSSDTQMLGGDYPLSLVGRIAALAARTPSADVKAAVAFLVGDRYTDVPAHCDACKAAATLQAVGLLTPTAQVVTKESGPDVWAKLQPPGVPLATLDAWDHAGRRPGEGDTANRAP